MREPARGKERSIREPESPPLHELAFLLLPETERSRCGWSFAFLQSKQEGCTVSTGAQEIYLDIYIYICTYRYVIPIHIIRVVTYIPRCSTSCPCMNCVLPYTSAEQHTDRRSIEGQVHVPLYIHPDAYLKNIGDIFHRSQSNRRAIERRSASPQFIYYCK